MKTVVITGGMDGIGRGLARVHLQRGGRGVAVGADEAKAEPRDWFRADVELVDEDRRLTDRLSAELTVIDGLVLGAGFQCSGPRRTETALLGRAAGPVADARRFPDRTQEVPAR
ncbi:MULTISPECIES: SDR family NAD(P)-dependent oxidoreductase [Streptomyces]|uniref:SDR family NAD(P)-dependent oxidoreductase n=1 Tax=Streptomyces TaxID=1883 RepID=UPI00163D0C58|nr:MULTISPECIES: SDR family NAD(P)-dependent oxidoreductase [Streptomyces]MBC2878392.1 SDR family NAD(P)-dependent oxidoreductase [Streptomyces sp. TYQ1024]UBI40494.1 SDR family NAD(P)-dependent oxidoreductase [Streptomyces mobaraensis]UKW33076.1 SDR family NAD(P)-dependent oxidoreductase [Streptomyces sp. TYQ1024]